MSYASELGATSRSILALAAKMGYPTIEQERELVRRCEAQDDRAVDEMVLRNARLVVPLMERFRDIAADDIFQAGLLGMWKGTHKIRLERWESSLEKMLKDQRGAPRPYAWFAQTCAKREMVLESVYQGSSVTRGKVNMSNRKRAMESTRVAWSRTSRVFSIDQSALAVSIKGGSSEHGEGISRERGLGIMSAVDRALQTPPHDPQVEMDFEVITGIMEEICTPREIDIIRSYYGLDGEACVLDDLSAKWMLCRERIRQIREEALAKIRKELSKREVLV